MATGFNIVNGDLVITTAGTLETLVPSKKCSRDLGKMLTTNSEYYGNETAYVRYNPSYGTELNNTSLYRNLSREAIRDVAVMKINEAVKDYIAVQESRTNLELGEIITYFNFDVVFDAANATKLIITISFGNAEVGDVFLNTFTQAIA